MIDKCPRCRRNCLSSYDDRISPLDNKTPICSECFDQSILCKNGSQDDVVEMYIENRFKEELGK